MKTRVDNNAKIGYDYRGRILIRSTDPNLYKNDTLRGFAVHLEEIIQNWIRQVKRIKTFVNYIVPADDDNIN